KHLKQEAHFVVREDDSTTTGRCNRDRRERTFRRAVSRRPISARQPSIMGILCDTQIRELIGIEPFEENLKRPGRVSFGVSSYGYDIRVGTVFKIFTNINASIIDPKNFRDDSFVTIDTRETGKDHVLIPPNSF